MCCITFRSYHRAAAWLSLELLHRLGLMFETDTARPESVYHFRSVTNVTRALLTAATLLATFHAQVFGLWPVRAQPVTRSVILKADVNGLKASTVLFPTQSCKSRYRNLKAGMC